MWCSLALDFRRSGKLSGKPQMPEWWDWDLPGGGIDGRWADPDPDPVAAQISLPPKQSRNDVGDDGSPAPEPEVLKTELSPEMSMQLAEPDISLSSLATDPGKELYDGKWRAESGIVKSSMDSFSKLFDNDLDEVD
eukprot:SAG31_NODE_1457_length_8260_cov_2.805416_3_plen_136_part_00